MFFVLDETSKRRYLEKLKEVLGSIEDPYTLKKEGSVKHDPSLWPCVEYPDIYYYLVTTPSIYSKDQLKAYKILEAYKYICR